MKNSLLNLEEIIRNMADSYGFVILLDTGKSVKVIMDNTKSLRLIGHVKTLVPHFEDGQKVRAKDFTFNMN
jgi:hypothetical protein